MVTNSIRSGLQRRGLAAASLALALTAAGAATIPPGTVLDARQEMVRNNGSEPETLDPSTSESNVSYNLLHDLFEGLTAVDNGNRTVPGIAESWRQADALTWVFKLRRNATWSDGQPVTADDFVYSWRRYVDPKTAAIIASTTGVYLANAAEILAGKKPPEALGVRAIDRFTLEVRTAGPTPFLPELLTAPQFSPLPRATIAKLGKDWTKPGNLVSDGPYVLKDWQVNSKVVLEKNPRYWDAANVTLTRVTYLPVEDPNADLKLYQSGENDMMLTLPAGGYEPLKKQYPKDMRNGPLLALRYYALNNRDPLLKDVRVRKALSMVIDREVLAAKVMADGQVPAYGLFFKGLNGADIVAYDWAAWPMSRRVAEARKLLAEAGVKPGTRLKFTYNTSEYHKKVGIFTASEWKSKLGLETEMDSLEFKVLLRKRHDGDFQVARDGWFAYVNDATNFLTLVQCDSDSNDNKNCNRHVDELIAQAGQSADAAGRKALLTEAGRLVMDDYPLIPLVQYSSPRLVKPYIGGYDESNLKGDYRSKDFYVIKH
jgi:oligopeptide transport system substrate-binding protein